MATPVVMNCTAALTELKLLDKRIEKKISGATYVSFEGQLKQKNKKVDEAKADFQSVNDLITRRTKIKSALIASNAITMVRINGQDMTVAEAIETKSAIKHKKRLLGELKRQYGETTREIERENSRQRKILETRFEKGSDEKDNTNNYEDSARRYMELNGVHIVDPLEIADKIKELEEYIDGFENQVDHVLSTKNATTEIKI